MTRLLIIYIALLVCSVTLSAQNNEVLDSVVVTDFRLWSDKKTQTSMMRIDKEDFNFKTVLSSPDVIKTLQMLPGVAPGNEMSSTMNVRGGTGSDNLYMMDNVPVYQSGHFLGLFSVFNTDVVKSVAFYKGGFPAQFGGRASSVVNVLVEEGNKQEHHASFSLGVTDGRFQIEGPIKRGKLSYNMAVRYGWVEAFLRPILNVVNVPSVSYSNEYTKDGHYGFSDFNVKFVWLKSNRDKVAFNAYWGFDFMSFRDSSRGRNEVLGGTTSVPGIQSYKDKNRWGNILFSTEWQRDISETQKMISTYYVSDGYYNALYESVKEYQIKDEDYKRFSLDNNLSRVLDIGAKVHFSDKSLTSNNLNYGASAVYHIFSPVGYSYSYMESDEQGRYGENEFSTGHYYYCPEFSVYAEDELTVTPNLYLNLGLRYMLFITNGTVYNSLEPRMAISYSPSRAVAMKLSYSEMGQPMHQLESFHSESPGSFWMPVTDDMRPIRSRLLCVETEWNPSRYVVLSFSGFLKNMLHLYEYTGNNALPSPSTWETDFTEGKGRSYGFEFYGEFQNEKWEASASYTLSWSQRYFEAFYDDWYRDRFDNRHNLVVNGVYKADKFIDFFATWILRSGNRYTIPLYGDYYTHGESLYPNNYCLPVYHRLDIGINFRAKSVRKARDYMVTFAVYNLYGRKNPYLISITEDVYNRPVIKHTSIFPILPSIRYTLYF